MHQHRYRSPKRPASWKAMWCHIGLMTHQSIQWLCTLHVCRYSMIHSLRRVAKTKKNPLWVWMMPEIWRADLCAAIMFGWGVSRQRAANIGVKCALLLYLCQFIFPVGCTPLLSDVFASNTVPPSVHLCLSSNFQCFVSAPKFPLMLCYVCNFGYFITCAFFRAISMFGQMFVQWVSFSHIKFIVGFCALVANHVMTKWL